MIYIGFGFVDALNRVFLGGGAGAEAFDLRKDEPHPVSFFLASPQFVADLAVDGVLGVDESLKVVGGWGHPLILSARAASRFSPVGPRAQQAHGIGEETTANPSAPNK